MGVPNSNAEKPAWQKALVQSLFIGGYLALAFAAVSLVHNRLAMASLAASAFIAFAFGKAQAARPRVLIGGYACGLVWGGLCCAALRALPQLSQQNLPPVIFFCVLAGMLCGFFMIIFKVQHPPAAALALSMVLEQNPIPIGIVTALCIVALSLLHALALRFFEPYFDSPK